MAGLGALGIAQPKLAAGVLGPTPYCELAISAEGDAEAGIPVIGVGREGQLLARKAMRTRVPNVGFSLINDAREPSLRAEVAALGEWLRESFLVVLLGRVSDVAPAMPSVTQAALGEANALTGAIVASPFAPGGEESDKLALLRDQADLFINLPAAPQFAPRANGTYLSGERVCGRSKGLKLIRKAASEW